MNEVKCVKCIEEDDVVGLAELVNEGISFGEPIFKLILQRYRDSMVGDLKIPVDHLFIAHVAAFYNAVSCLSYIHYQLGMSLWTLTQKNYNPWHYACANGSLEAVGFIADVSTLVEIQEIPPSDYDYFTLSIRSGSPGIIRMLLDRGFPFPASENEANKLVCEAIKSRNASCLVPILHERSRLNRTASRFGRLNPIMEAALHDEGEGIDILLDAFPEIDVHEESDKGHSAFHIACHYQNINSIDKLLKRVDVRRGDSTGYPIHWVIQLINPRIIARLLEKDVDVNVIDRDGNPPAHLMAYIEPSGLTNEQIIENGLEILEMLANHGYDFNQIAPFGMYKGMSLIECLATAIAKRIPWIVFLLHRDVVIRKPCNEHKFDFVAYCRKNAILSNPTKGIITELEAYLKRNKLQ